MLFAIYCRRDLFRDAQIIIIIIVSIHFAICLGTWVVAALLAMWLLDCLTGYRCSWVYVFVCWCKSKNVILNRKYVSLQLNIFERTFSIHSVIRKRKFEKKNDFYLICLRLQKSINVCARSWVFFEYFPLKSNITFQCCYKVEKSSSSFTSHR